MAAQALIDAGFPITVTPYELAELMTRDGTPRDAINQRIRPNDIIRIWTRQAGWTYERDFFVKHALPRWSPTHQYITYTYLIVPQLDEFEQSNDPNFLGEDVIELVTGTVILITHGESIAIREGIAQERIDVVVDDFQIIKVKNANTTELIIKDEQQQQGGGGV